MRKEGEVRSLKPSEFRSPALFDRRSLVRLLLPLIIEQFLMMTVGMADTIMVATAGEAAVSGISLVDSINLLLIQVFAALSTGGTVVVSQYLGRRDADNADRSAKQLLHSATLMALILMAIALIFRRGLLTAIFGHIDAAVMDNALDYFLYTSLAYPFMAVYNAGAALFRAMGNSKVSMYVSLVVNIVNITVNAVLIYGFNMAAAGAGIGTLTSRVVAAVIMVVLMRRRSNVVRIHHIWKPEWQPDLLRRILGIGIPNGMENGMFQVGKLLVAGLISTFGTAAISANAISNTIGSVVQVPGQAIGLGLVAVVGQCMGARQDDQAVYFSRRLLLVAYLSVGPLSALMFLLAGPLVSLFGLSAAATAAAIEILRWFAVFNIFIYPIAFVLPNALRGAGDAKFTMAVSMFSMWAFRIGCSYLFCMVFELNLLGVWLAMFVDWIVRASIFVTRFQRGRWKSIRLI